MLKLQFLTFLITELFLPNLSDREKLIYEFLGLFWFAPGEIVLENLIILKRVAKFILLPFMGAWTVCSHGTL